MCVLYDNSAYERMQAHGLFISSFYRIQESCDLLLFSTQVSALLLNAFLTFQASFGPPFALIQGTLNAQGTAFEKLPGEFCPTVRRGSVAWVGSGPEFFISLANHVEWKKSYTVFGYVLPEDMEIAEKIAQLPTKSDVWNNIKVAVLEKPVSLLIRRMKNSQEDLNQSAK